MEELSDHLDDLNEDGMDADAFSRLGEPEQLADAAVAAYRRRSFLGRHPLAALLVFSVSPMIAQCLLFTVVGALFSVASSWLPTIEPHRGYNEYDAVERRLFAPGGRMALLYAIILLRHALASAVASVGYGFLGWRSRVEPKWILVSCAILAEFAALDSARMGLPVGWTAGKILVQVVVPLAVGWWFLRRKPDQGQLQLAT